MGTPPERSLPRRAVLLGGLGTALLAACGGGDDDGVDAGADADTDTTLRPGRNSPPAGGDPSAQGATTFSLVRFFGDDVLVAGTEQRVPFGLGDRDGVVTGDVPAMLEFSVLDEDGEALGAAIAAESRGEGIPRPYFPVRFAVDAPGIYTMVTEYLGERLESAVQVNDPAGVPIPGVGQPMVPSETPTTADGRGVDPICTREPDPCPLHDVTLTEALGEGRPVALLISTPKFCQVSICGPVLEVLLAQQSAYPQVRMVHAEVFTDETTSMTTRAVQDYALSFEPCLFVAKADGTVAERLDTIFDAVEVRAALDKAL